MNKPYTYTDEEVMRQYFDARAHANRLSTKYILDGYTDSELWNQAVREHTVAIDLLAELDNRGMMDAVLDRIQQEDG